MRQPALETSRSRRPLVGLLVEPSSEYGRAILRGVTRYANLQRRWVLYKDLQRVLDARGTWPKFDGAIFAGVPGWVFEYGRRQCPNVVRCSGAGDPAESAVVALDDEAVGAQAAQHLMDCRLERFAFFGLSPDFTVPAKRLAGFRRALEARGHSCIECPLYYPTPQQWISHDHRPALIQWLRELPKPIGVMTFDDASAHDLAEACLETDIAVPEHVAIVGVNNDDLLCESAWPPLSSVEGDFARVGYAAAKVLDRMLAGETLPAKDRLTLLPPLGVVQRQSTNILAVNDPNLADALRFIREHACDPCSVGDVLAAVPVGRRWLERQFVSQIGRTPHDEIVRVRIDAARRLLLHSDLGLAEIAGRCGYSGDKNFHTAFRQITGTTPAVFRKAALHSSGE